MPEQAISISRNTHVGVYDVYNNDRFIKSRLYEPPTVSFKTVKKREQLWIIDKPIVLSVTTRKLSHIAEAIEDSKYILGLVDNWDDEKAVKVPVEIYNRAIKFLIDYSEYVQYKYNTIISAPRIAPLSDGSIDLYWTTESANLLVNIKNTKTPMLFYYGELSDNVNHLIDFNGQITTIGVIDQFASWLVNLSKMEDRIN